ncbi:MAG: hypothetical protein K6A82_03910 [Prevotella sp.]|nr:hypothetical protein [Prevotella sp.]
MKRYTILLLLFGMCTAIGAQIPIVRNFTSTDYAGGTQNWAVSQSSDDRMFFANNSGLLEFDGDHWYNFPIQNYTNVRSVQYDAKTERIFAGATDEFGYFYTNPKTFRLDYQSLSSLLPARERSFGEIWHIHDLQGGKVFESKSRLFWLKGSKEVVTIPVPYRVETSAVVNGRLYVSCLEENYAFDGHRLLPLPGSELLLGKQVRAILPLYDKVLFVTASDGMYLYDGRTLSPYILDITPLLISTQVFCAAINGNSLAFGTVKGGLVVKNLKTGVNLYANALTGLQNNTILSLKFDRDRNIWLGLDNGISYVMLESPFRDLLGINNNIGTGYASLVSGDRLYLGTNQGLFFTSAKDINSVFRQKPIPVDGVAGQIWSLRNVGGHLVCGADAGTFLIRAGKAVKIPGPQGTWDFKPLRQHPGYVLSCDYQGFFIFRLTDSGLEFSNRIRGFNESSGGFEEDADGSIWLSHWQKGIYHFRLSADLKRAERVEYFHRGNGLPADDNNLICKVRGHVYTSSVDGFRHYDDRTGKLVKDKWLNSVFDTYGQSLRLQELPDGKLWAYKDKFLAVATPVSGHYEVHRFSFGNLVRRLQMSLGHIGMLDGHHTLLNYDNGFFMMRDSYQNVEAQKHFFLRSIWSISGERDSLLYSHFPSQKEQRVEVPHALNSLRLEFVLPEYRDNRAVVYTCKLEGYEETWSVPQPATYKEYTQLGKGTYTFRVRATNLVTGQTAETSIEIKILPAWYETWFAYFVYMILAVILLRVLLFYLRRRADRELIRVQAEKERQLKEQQAQFLIEEEKREKELVKLRNDQLTVELKHKSGELADSTMNLVRKNDMLQEIDEQMQELSESVRREEMKAKLTKKINDIRRGIKMNMNDDDNWEKFQENFNLVYDNFMQRLISDYPDLKKNDLKLCAYLKMGLSSKEMASLLNTSVRSVETARYRLRKKLDLESGENLTNFIQTFDKK